MPAGAALAGPERSLAVLYSYPSIFVHGRSACNKSWPSHYAALLAWQNVIHDLNMRYDFVTETTLTSDEFAARGYKVLVLPQVWALSEGAMAGIRRFVEAGGMVLADIRPAQYCERARQRPSAAMDDLFGLKGGFAAAQSADMKLAGELGLSKLELTRPGGGHDRPVQAEQGVTLTTGKAIGKATEIVLPLAWNDPTGEWTITLTDLFSRETEQTVTASVE